MDHPALPTRYNDKEGYPMFETRVCGHMAGILPKRRKTQDNQSINQSINQSYINIDSGPWVKALSGPWTSCFLFCFSFFVMPINYNLLIFFIACQSYCFNSYKVFTNLFVLLFINLI